MHKLKLVTASVLSGVFTILPLAQAGAVANTIIVRPSNTQGWVSTGVLAETRANGHVNFVHDTTSPLPPGALQLATDTVPPGLDKAQYMHPTATKLADVKTLGYSTKQIAASFAAGDASYQLGTCLYGVTTTGCAPAPAKSGSNYATFVYEPYIDKGNSAVVNGVWQSWDVAGGKLWSSKNAGPVVKSEGSSTYSLATLKSDFPNAVVYGYGVNVGSNNPGYTINVDKFVFNDTTYNFEQDLTYPTTKDSCKNDGYKTFTGVTFKNQGQCIKYVKDHSPAEEVQGALSLSGPSQKIRFDVSNDNNEHAAKLGTVEYWNYDYPGGLHYEANVQCVGGDKSNKEARVLFQIPAGHPGLSGLYVVSYVKEASNHTFTYGHAATSDLATATTWCKSGTGFAPQMFTVTKGKVSIE